MPEGATPKKRGKGKVDFPHANNGQRLRPLGQTLLQGVKCESEKWGGEKNVKRRCAKEKGFALPVSLGDQDLLIGQSLRISL